ncbi:hypothetical protein EV426DRAFT_710105 [Tirmania nivea]|nr:hypothetical protein EV426DRAFT_710105 [Tirmania nivea]
MRRGPTTPSTPEQRPLPNSGRSLRVPPAQSVPATPPRSTLLDAVNHSKRHLNPLQDPLLYHKSKVLGTYFPATGKLILNPTISSPHALVTSFFRHACAAEGGVTLPGNGTPVESFILGKGPARTKEADFSLGVRETIAGLVGSFTPSRPTLIMEFSNIVRCVIFVRIKEGPRAPHDQEDSGSASSTMGMYRLKEASFFQNQVLTAQWAGELSAYAEIWRMNMATGKAEEQYHMELLPRPEYLPVLPLRREDLGLSPVIEGKTDELSLDMSPGAGVRADGKTTHGILAVGKYTRPSSYVLSTRGFSTSWLLVT